MLRPFPRLARLGAAASTVVLACLPTRAEAQPRGGARGLDSALAVATADSAWSRIARTYYDSTFKGLDWDSVGRDVRARAAVARTPDELRRAIGRMLGALGESHFALLPASPDDDPGAGEGDGELGLELRLVDGRALVSRVRPGSPAAEGGVRTGWEVQRLGALDVPAFVRARL